LAEPVKRNRPGLRSPIDGPLHRTEQSRLALDLVESHRPCSTHQGFGVAPRSVEHVEVVQRREAPRARHEVLGQSALPGLPRARDNDRGHHPQALGEGRANQAEGVFSRRE
jgi:hypothetical protein